MSVQVERLLMTDVVDSWPLRVSGKKKVKEKWKKNSFVIFRISWKQCACSLKRVASYFLMLLLLEYKNTKSCFEKILWASSRTLPDQESCFITVSPNPTFLYPFNVKIKLLWRHVERVCKNIVKTCKLGFSSRQTAWLLLYHGVLMCVISLSKLVVSFSLFFSSILSCYDPVLCYWCKCFVRLRL